MTREIKIGMAVAGSFLSLVGVVVGTKLYNGDIPEPIINASVGDASAAVKEHEHQKKPIQNESPKVIQTKAVEGAQPLFALPNEPIQQSPPQNGFSPPPAPIDLNASGLPPVPAAPLPPVGAGSEPAAAQNAVLDNLNAAKGRGNAGANVTEERKPFDQFASALPIPTPITEPNPVPSATEGQTLINGGVKKPNSPNDFPSSPPQPVATPGLPPVTPGLPPAAPETPKAASKETAPNPPGFPEIKPTKDFNPPTPPGFAPIPKETLPPVASPTQPIVNPSPSTSTLPPLTEPAKPAITTPSSPIVPAPKNEPTAPLPPLNPQQNAPNNLPAVPQPGTSFGPTNTNPPQSPFNLQPSTNFNAPPMPPLNQVQTVPTTPPPFNGQQSFDPPATPLPSNTNPFQTTAPSSPLVKTDDLKPYICVGNESFEQIARAQYGPRVNFGPALEQFNRDYPGAPLALRQQPAQIQPGIKIMIPSQEYLLDKYAQFVPGTIRSIPPITPVNNNGSIGSQIGLNPPAAGNKAPAATGTSAGFTNYTVPNDNMYLSKVAELQLGSALRWIDIYRLNPDVQPEQPLRKDRVIKLPLK